MTGDPTPTRSLRNDVARALMEGCDLTPFRMRRCLEDAQVAIDAVANYTLVFGPDALIEALL